jgi:hypothetical protein
MVKINILLNSLCSIFIVASLSSCNDYDPVSVDYEVLEEETGNVITPPDIKAEWELELVTNTGQHNPKVFVYKDKKYNNLFTRNLGWNGGDGVLTTLLPDGNIFWSFNDSFYGVVDSETRARGNCSFPRNSLMIQTKGTDGKPGETDENLVWLADFVQTDNPNGERYYQARTHIRHPQASLSDEDIQKGEIDQDYLYWAGDATIVGGKLQMIWGAVDNTDPNNQMRRFGSCLATYSLEGEPGDENYMKLIERKDSFLDVDDMGYGNTMHEDEDGHTYLYTTNGYDVLVARSTTHDLETPWEYYIRDLSGNFQWISSFPTEEERKRSNILTNNGQCSMPWVFKKGDMYYLVGQSLWFGHAMHIYRSNTPYGPFTDQKVLFVVPETIDKIGNQYYNHLYMVNLHPHLARAGELVFSTNTDCANFWDNFNRAGSADYYRPFFFRVFNWESIYDESE